MFILILSKPVMIAGELVKMVGPFPSVATVQTWIDTFTDGIDLPDMECETIYVPPTNERLPISLTKKEPEPDAIKTANQMLAEKIVLEPIVDPIVRVPVPSGVVLRDDDGVVKKRFVSVEQYEAAASAKVGICLACGEQGPAKPLDEYRACPNCGLPYVTGVGAIAADGRVLANSKRKA